jgi:hypothetical protein
VTQDVNDIASTAPVSPYGCDDFNADRGGDVLYRYVSCGGGATAPCGAAGDIIPDEQQNLPYLAIGECPGVTASYRDFPSCPHTLCGAWDTCGGAEAVAWLEDNGW